MCQCSEAVAPPVEPEVSCAEAEEESKSENIPDHKVKPGAKRKRSCKGAGEPAAKKILGDGTRLPGSPVTWKSSSTGILIKSVNFSSLICSGNLEILIKVKVWINKSINYSTNNFLFSCKYVSAISQWRSYAIV